jgi:hypothetical protein
LLVSPPQIDCPQVLALSAMVHKCGEGVGFRRLPELLNPRVSRHYG